jgi:hypothetical protein
MGVFNRYVLRDAMPAYFQTIINGQFSPMRISHNRFVEQQSFAYAFGIVLLMLLMREGSTGDIGVRFYLETYSSKPAAPEFC